MPGNIMINVCYIYGSEVTFKKYVPLEKIQEVCQDIWDNPDQYSEYEKDSDAAYYDFLKFLWVKFPNGEHKRLDDLVQL